ncbi:S1 family peptidase [Streptomyces acidiscabies]|uniref:S1 family peptidase n=1 Tax=Streptomyces acidiscabies TaxID=42234 RepID=A0AAP6ECZ1_9ACTN|nr:S1 family peptidase [Streptomyces acidiscabies]MBP5941596.1 S1 family peptidase [Streptomyces sp. LBUM 1476]MBZ3912988.1 S1 family peptidase [Streptomyces acidiscabies]MDX2958473.1 S1 family peptidase [Streptomyces acidiscabies]MDX3021021.1 S1 family peptidase [Streptomyces acidiscabies]MDX3794976.1 S1 family peptidase [Streptomyces acidiscabies]
MRHVRRRTVRRVTRLAAVGGVLLGGVMVAQAAMAGETPNSSSLVRSSADTAGQTGTELTKRLGTARTAGSWIGADGKPVVAVTDDTAADEVRKAGAQPKMVGHSMNELKAATTTLKDAPRVAGTAWSVDYRTNKVVVQADSTVSADDWSRMTKVASGIGSFVQMERTKGKFTTRVNGALPILSTSGRCSAGFNVTNGQQDFILTAGHCGPNGSIWFGNDQASQEIGQTVDSSFPGGDYSVIQYANGKAGEGADIVAIGNGNGVKITGFGDPVVGQRVFRSGSTTGLRDGQVTALNSTVNYPEGTVTGLIETNVCAEPGDSGGPMFSEGIALGVTSGGSGDCTAGGTTFFQPVTTALASTKLKLIVAARADGAQQGGAAPSPSPTQAAIAPGSAAPGSTTPVNGTSLASKLTNPLAIGPGLLIIAASMGALFFTRYLREERDRKEYQRYYAANWS